MKSKHEPLELFIGAIDGMGDALGSVRPRRQSQLKCIPSIFGFRLFGFGRQKCIWCIERFR